MCIHKSLLAIAGVAVLGVLMTASAQAWITDTTYVTFSAPVALPGVTLPAGTYVFQSPSELDKNIVQILNRKGSKSYFMGLTVPVERPRGENGVVVTLGEAAPGQATPVKAWFPLGQRDGHLFVYHR